MLKGISYFLWVLPIWMMVATVACRGQAATPPRIEHQPVNVAAEGHAISILAHVKPGGARLKTVTLHYAPSRDASPLKQAMTHSGRGVYVGTIPAAYLGKTPKMSYYIEAVDEREEWAETQWHEIQILKARPEPAALIDRTSERVPVKRSPYAQAPVTPGNAEGAGISTTTWVIGGLAAGAAIAIAAAAGGGGRSAIATNAMTVTGGGGNDGPSETNTVTCTRTDPVGTWIGVTDPVIAPGFALFPDNSGQFLDELGGTPGVGSWTLVGCDLTLFPTGTNIVYRGTGTISDDKSSVTINGFTYRKGG